MFGQSIFDKIDQNNPITAISEPTNLRAYIDEVLQQIREKDLQINKRKQSPQGDPI
ncbi:MAG: hypothetical protein ACRD5B_12380 [Nitrososphaeraceae archaeon]